MDKIRRSVYKREIGKTYGRLQVIELVGVNEKGNYEYECICECGTTAIVQGQYLRSGETESCGCLKEEQDDVNLREKYESKRVNGVAVHLFNDKARRTSSTGYRGVFRYLTRVSKEERFGAWITVKKKRYYKKGFSTPEEAYYNGRLVLEELHLPENKK